MKVSEQTFSRKNDNFISPEINIVADCVVCIWSIFADLKDEWQDVHTSVHMPGVVPNENWRECTLSLEREVPGQNEQNAERVRMSRERWCLIFFT